MLKYRGLAFKLNTLILVVSGIVFICAILFNYYSTKKLLSRETVDDIEIIGELTSKNIERVLLNCEVATKTLAGVVKNDSCYKENTIIDTLSSVVEDHQEIFGASVTFAPYAYNPNVKFYSPYVCETADSLRIIDDRNDSYDYRNESWYAEPLLSQKGCWSDPYFEKDAANEMIVTYSVPFFKISNGKKEFRGVALVDLSLEWLNNLLEKINSFGSGYAFIISKTGKIIYSPPSSFIPEHLCQYTIFEYAQKINNPVISDLGKEMLSGKQGFIYSSSKWKNKTGWFYYTPIETTNWSLSIFFPDEKFQEEVKRLNLELLFICFFGLFLLMILTFLITNKLTLPLKKLTYSVKKIGKGDLHETISVTKSNDEVGILTKAFEEMRKSLISYIDNLRKTTSEKESYETEIKIGAALQASIIPIIDEKFRSPLFDIYAKLVPAKDISGDFYDIFYLNEDTLAFAVADVSGKGVPAAFFMSMAKFAIKNVCSTVLDLSPAKVLELANNLICSENPSCMFVTCYLAFYNIRSGELTYANAGHHSFLHRFSDGKVEMKGVLRNRALGLIPDDIYSEGKIVIEPGDLIAIYTDGIIEAENKNYTQFGEDAVIEYFAGIYPENINKIGDSLIEKVMDFEEHKRFDDITLLILKRN